MRKYLLAFGIIVCAFALTVVSRGAFQQSVFVFFTCAVAITAYACGTGPALAAMLAAIVSAAFGLLDPIGSLRISSISDLARLIAFTASSALIIAIVHRLRSTQERLQSTLADLDYIKTARGVWNWAYDIEADRVIWSSNVDEMEVRQERNLRGWLELIHPDDRGQVEQNLRTALTSGNLEIDYRMNLSADSMVRFLTRAKLAGKSGDGEPRLVGISMEPVATLRAPAVTIREKFSGTRG